jgi:catechol 2,3-dioxygenase-like lactoylglutathione lyase family enzyme/heme-degrading monooxygenase HmoA
MLHHIDVHVGDLKATKRLFGALAPAIGYRLRADADNDDFAGYEPVNGGCPRVGFEQTERYGSGMMRLAFGVESREAVDAAARIASESGARNLEGPSLHPEYGDDYYAVFFEDADGNLYEISAEPEAARKPRVARVWRGRVRKELLEKYRGYIESTGLADYRKTPGNRGAYMLTVPRDEFGEVITLSFWDTRDSISAFAGEPIERARYYPEDEVYLLDFPERVDHYDLDS